MNSDNEDKNRMGCARGMPLKPKLIMDEDAEEVTRKIAPTMIMPSLGPLPTMPTGMISSPTFNSFRSKTSTLQQQQHGNDSKSTPFSWKLSYIPVLPEFHPLERTATLVPNAMPADIGSRISDVLRERSIEAQYENGKAKVKCTTAEGVDFRIRLYRGRGRYNHGIIVEVQRRFGTSFVFHNDTQAILNGAQGEVPAPPAPLMTSTNNLPEVSDIDDKDDEDYDGSYQVPSAESSLAMVAKMMKLPSFESQYLGLQMLLPLVNSERLSLSTARTVASGLFEKDCEVGEKVFDYIIKNSNKTRTIERGVFDDDDDDDDDYCDSSKILRNASLDVLANATKAYGKVPEFLRNALRPVLLRDLHNSEKHPNTAFSSAKCLEYFILEDHDNRELNNAFQVAYKAGESRHANLMHQAQKCMSINDSIIR